jgi:cysteinyl-tRNA synthetase
VDDLTSLRLYNTRTHRVEAFEPMQGDRVRIYVCGLTPSAQAHLGHARSFLFFDLLRRYLTYRGYAVTYVQNVTDIDDRSIATARDEGTTYRAVVDAHYASFKASMQRLGVREPDEEPYATEHIGEIQAMIRQLVYQGHAYAVDGGVYYAVRTFPRYGELSRRNLEELEAGARIEVDEHKRDPLDFALWKVAKAGEPSWPFEGFGAGRPGWHIECSAMSRALLDPEGVGFDIHGGGADLIFPHHENEVAQSEPLMKHPPMANVWVHGGLLLFDNRKMSKSLGNFEPLSDLLERHDPQAIRLLFLQTGYRKVMNFTQESIAAAGVVLDRLKKAYRSLSQAAGTARPTGVSTGLLDRVGTALADDMNTAVALAGVLQFAASTDLAMQPSTFADALHDYTAALTLLGIEPNASWKLDPGNTWTTVRLEDTLPPITETLTMVNRLWGSDRTGTVEQIIAEREAARKSKKWGEADKLRQELLDRGIELIDTPEGTKWRDNTAT